MSFLLIGLNHRSAPVEIREKLSQLCVAGLPGADGKMLEAVTVLTCNRVEAYFYGSEESGERLFAEWVSTSGTPYADMTAFFYKLRDREAIDHLFRVSSGLDSMVLGESQILHQVKDSYQAAIQVDSLGKHLHALFQKALEVGKRARTETRISENTVSIASTAVELAEQIFDSLRQSSVLVIGAGEMATLVARHLKDKGVGRLVFTNRTLKRAEDLAMTFSGTALPFSDLPRLISEADIVVSSTGAPRPIIDPPLLEGMLADRSQRPLFAIDIAVPRDIEPACGELENVFLYNIDDLQGVVDENLNIRKEEAKKAEQIIESEVALFQATLNSFSAVPLIRSLRERTDEMRRLELERFLAKHRDLSPEFIGEIEYFSKALLAKWLHHPILALKEHGSSSRQELIELASMFGLSESVVPSTCIVSLESREKMKPKG